MATVVDGTPPFLENFGYATFCDEYGRPMHKSWGNMIEFNEAADKMGVDVMRWLFASHISETDLLFGYKRGDEVRRQFLIPLWNIYSFFVTYANLDGWIPSPEGFDPASPEGPAPKGDNLLDRWILARMSQLVAAVTRSLEESDHWDAAKAVEIFLDDLSNWYVRRSRRRFWKSEQDADKKTAYTTLYHVLVRLAKLLAPFTPFVTESIYQNLVRTVQPEAYLSVHHCAWPQADPQPKDEDLLAQMALARQIASLGLGARSSANIKVRQPLARALAYVGGEQKLDSEMVDIITDELNVKRFEFVSEATKLVTYRILPENKLLGPRFGAKFPRFRAALTAANPGEVAAKVQSGQEVSLDLDGEQVTLAPNEILVQTQPVEGLAVASDKGITVAVDAVLTPELKAEGLARELVRRLQAMRKDAGFNINDRITTNYVAQSELAQVLESWADYIRAETLSTDLVAANPEEGAYIEIQQVDGSEITLGVKQRG